MEFTDLAREQLPRLYGLARQLVGEDAEDLVQECLLKAYRSHAELRDRQAAPAWLTKIMVNCARDRFRSRGRRVREAPLPDVEDFSLYRVIAAEDPFPYSDSLHLDFLHRFGPEDVWAVLRSLPEIYRLPLVLVHMHDVSTKHAARLLDVPLGTLLARLHRGRKQFEKDLWAYARQHDLLREPAREGNMIRCEDALRELWGYLCDEVTPESRARIAEHLDACRRCCGEIEFLDELRHVVAASAPELPADVGVRMEAFLATLEGGTDDRPDAQG